MMKNNKTTKYSVFLTLLFIAILAVVIMVPDTASAQSTAGYVTGYGVGQYNYIYPNNTYNSGYNYTNTGYAYNNNYNAPTYNPTPRIYSMSPSTVNKNSTSFVAVINGDGFIPSSTVRVNGENQITTYISPSRLEMRLNNLSQMSTGGHIVNVYNPNTNSFGYSNDVTLKVNTGTVASTNTSTKTVAKKASTTTTTVATTKATTNKSEESLVAGAIFGTSEGFLPTGLMQWILFIIFVLLIIYLWRKIYNAPKYEMTPLKHH
ncbi:MAG: hypothetical protein WC783_01225 [Candidatus Paceibacterota bacterium]|jgi:hypothetical protein